MKIIQFKKAEIENNPYQKQRAKLTYRKESKKKKKTYRNTDGFDGFAALFEWNLGKSLFQLGFKGFRAQFLGRWVGFSASAH